MQVRQAESYELLCLAGDGGQAQVFLASKGNRKAVVKLYFPHNQAQTYYSKEVTLLSRLHSNHIVKLIEHFSEGKVTLGNTKEVRPMVVLQLAEHGQLFKIVNISRLSEDVSRTLFKQLLKAIKEMKEAEVGHLDIKLQNILLDENYNLKLTDFGHGKDLSKQPQFLSSWQGTLGYMAPEVHNYKYKAYEVDLFAAGVALFLMVFRMPPFESTAGTNVDYNLLRKGRYQQFWKKFERRVQASMPLKRMLTKIFALDPSRRPSLSELQSEEWLLGPTLSQEDLKKYMEPRYNRLQKRDKETINIRMALRDRIKDEMMEIEKDERDRSRSREHSSKRSKESESFLQELTNLELQSSELQKKHFGCFYAEAEPKLILLWLHEFLEEHKRNGSIFIESADTVQFSSFWVQLKQKGKIELSLEYCLSYQQQSWLSKIILDGQLIEWQKKYALIWKTKAGNDFWGCQIKAKLSEEFQLIFE